MESGAAPGWLAVFAGELESQALADQMRRFLRVWGLSASEASRLFGVSRQAVSKWFTQGVPADRVEAVADLAAATDLLVRYLKVDRIPATVRQALEPPGSFAVLYLNEDLVTARLNLRLFISDWPFEPEDLRDDTGPCLAEAHRPRPGPSGRARPVGAQDPE